MKLIEIAVNVPIRRTFGRDAPPPPPRDVDESGEAADESSLQSFHYHLPPELETVVEPGHLVWVPFGPQKLQGIVLRMADYSPVPTKAVLRLARPEPVLTPVQIKLAEWIALQYVAPLAEAIKLFLPPGLLARADGTAGVRAKRELKITLLAHGDEAQQRLAKLAKTTQASKILAWLIGQTGMCTEVGPKANTAVGFPWKRIKQEAGVSQRGPLASLQEAGLLEVDGDLVRLIVGNEQAKAALRLMYGLDKYAVVIATLESAGAGLWKSELYDRVVCDLDMLRDLQGAGIVDLHEEGRSRDPLAGRSYPVTSAPPLTSEQRAVWQQVRAAFDELPAARRPFLLHGVTGSGKTEIYLHAIAETLGRGQQAIVLVPEIALTPQTVARFAGRFPGHVTVIHSELTTGERYDVWRAIRAGEYNIVVGPRSALFAPMERLGLIVIDEEHESTYKQDAEQWGSFKVFYDARRVARQYATMTGGVLIMGSATPSLDVYYAAENGEFRLLEMPRRVLGHRGREAGETLYAEMPPVEIVDMRQELRAGNRSIFSRSLASELLATLDADEQAILFLNRRGTHTFVMCRDCGHVEECPRCETPLTLHDASAHQGTAQKLVCHRCNYQRPVPVACPVQSCESKRIKFFGAGTERIEEAVREIAPHARVLRWDADTTMHKGSHEAILRRFASHEANVLIGTQMIAKGLDLPLVTLVGVIAADVGLFLPDFRSGERTFQLLTQVAGRAGRSERGGRVVIQSYRPEHHAIQAAAQHDYAAFFTREMAFRREHLYPPVRRLARLIFWEKNEQKAKRESERMAAVLRTRAAQIEPESGLFDIMGPAPAFFERFRGSYRWQILVSAPDPAAFLRGIDIPFGWRVDVDPVGVL
jgi:primosomal protein N' (replication factor Y) (superfamily II helicase)